MSTDQHLLDLLAAGLHLLANLIPALGHGLVVVRPAHVALELLEPAQDIDGVVKQRHR